MLNASLFNERVLAVLDDGCVATSAPTVVLLADILSVDGWVQADADEKWRECSEMAFVDTRAEYEQCVLSFWRALMGMEDKYTNGSACCSSGSGSGSGGST